MNRFFVSPDCIQGSRVILPSPVAHQLHRVLRMRPGAQIMVLDNQGWEYEVQLAEVGSQQAAGEVTARRPAPGEPDAGITLYQCVLKKGHFEWVLEKCTEIGVKRFVPVVSQRTIVNDLKSIDQGKLPRWQRIITEAAEQSGRAMLPALAEPVLFNQAVRQIETFDLALIPWEEEKSQTLRAALSSFKDAPWVDAGPEIAVFIGPEGGYAGQEITLARQYGAMPVTLGPRILRAETAAMVASLLVLHELGETAHPPQG